jgi:LuxR family maltose regulon positive regulatory protein
VVSGELHTGDDAACIALDSPAWFAWVADDAHHSFHFTHPCGDFTARKERKQRGQWYWVAYRQVHGTLYKTYLGKSDTLTDARLCAAAATLAQLAADGGASRAAAADP